MRKTLLTPMNAKGYRLIFGSDTQPLELPTLPSWAVDDVLNEYLDLAAGLLYEDEAA